MLWLTRAPTRPGGGTLRGKHGSKTRLTWWAGATETVKKTKRRSRGVKKESRVRVYGGIYVEPDDRARSKQSTPQPAVKIKRGRDRSTYENTALRGRTE